jgi:hypothetical protein
VVLAGDGDLDAAAGQVCRFLALDVDGRGWPQVGRRDPVIAAAQARLPGLRPCGFHSPYDAAAWSVLAQRLRIVQAARLRAELIARHGEDGAFPPPHTLARLDLDLPGRKGEYLRAVAEAALDGLLDGAALRAVGPEDAVQRVQQVKGLGPFAAELIVARGANASDALPHHERRLDAEIADPGVTKVAAENAQDGVCSGRTADSGTWIPDSWPAVPWDSPRCHCPAWSGIRPGRNAAGSAAVCPGLRHPSATRPPRTRRRLGRGGR